MALAECDVRWRPYPLEFFYSRNARSVWGSKIWTLSMLVRRRRGVRVYPDTRHLDQLWRFLDSDLSESGTRRAFSLLCRGGLQA